MNYLSQFEYNYYLCSAFNSPALFLIFSIKNLLTYILQKNIFLFFFSNKISRNDAEIEILTMFYWATASLAAKAKKKTDKKNSWQTLPNT